MNENPSMKMTNELVVDTPNGRLTEKYSGLLVKFSQWFGKDRIILQIHFLPPDEQELVDRDRIFTFIWDLSPEQQKMNAEGLTALFAKKAKLRFTYDPPLKPCPGQQPRPNGEFDKFRTILSFGGKRTRSLCAPMPCVREYVAWIT